MKRGAVVTAVLGLCLLAPATAAFAHPLGNFTVNHYDGLTFAPHAVRDLAVLDSAEIPTAQARGSVDVNHDGVVSAAERSTYAGRRCLALASGLSLRVGGRAPVFRVLTSSYDYRPGAAGLQTGRLTCSLTAMADLSTRTRVRFRDGFESDRIGWHEITAVGVGTHLRNSPVPAKSVSAELLRYPNDLLSTPLDVRAASIQVEPGAGTSTFARTLAAVPGAGPIARVVDRLNRFFTGLAGARHLTLGVGLAAVLVSLLLGASHAALPGHGKTVMAAYLAGKRGRTRDAVVVGATVTATHTVGVLALGLALTLSSSIAGEKVTADLGVASGVLIAAIGVGLIVNVVRSRHHHHHEHGHDHDHDHDHGHDHSHPRGRAGLVGMGVAGGLVPSPSALVVLLGAIALGRTLFGVLLVIAYGVGMAATLTAVGLLLVRLSDRWSARPRRAALVARLGAATPAMTAGIVVVVGLGLAARSLALAA